MNEKIIVECDLSDLVMLYESLLYYRAFLKDSVSVPEDKENYYIALNRYRILFGRIRGLLFDQV